MMNHIDPRQSVAARQLSELGSDASQGVLQAAAERLDDRELVALDAEIKLYADTGLVGLLMSRLIGLLPSDGLSEAA